MVMPYNRCASIFIGPLPKLRVSVPVPKLNGSVSSVGSNFSTMTKTARKPDAKPNGMPMASRNNMPISRISEIVPISMNVAPIYPVLVDCRIVSRRAGSPF